MLSWRDRALHWTNWLTCQQKCARWPTVAARTAEFNRWIAQAQAEADRAALARERAA